MQRSIAFREAFMRPQGLREQRRKFCAEHHGCIWHWRPEKCMPRILGLEAHECCILGVLGRPCIGHFGPGIWKKEGNQMSRIAGPRIHGAKNCHLSRVLAIVAAGRSMGETDRSGKRQAFGPRALKCCKIKHARMLQTCNFSIPTIFVCPC